MNRVSQVLKSKIFVSAIVVVILAAALTVALVEKNNNGNLQTVTNSQHKITQISYDGQSGINAYALLKKHATVKATKYSFGYLVTSIDGVAGNGPKYWTFYVNGKESNVGASAFVTKNSDRITWKLQ